MIKPVVLSYAVPPVFYSGVCKYQTLRALVAASILLCMTMCCGIIVATSRNMINATLICGSTAVTCGIAASIAIYLWFTNVETMLRITEDGVEYGRRFWEWSKIQSIRGELVTKPAGVVLVIRPRGGIQVDRCFQPDPPLSESEFDMLAKRLRGFVSAKFPRVRIDVTPYVSST